MVEFIEDSSISRRIGENKGGLTSSLAFCKFSLRMTINFGKIYVQAFCFEKRYMCKLMLYMVEKDRF